jgi:hypothetical protein
MSTPTGANGQNFAYPTDQETGYASEATGWAQAVTAALNAIGRGDSSNVNSKAVIDMVSTEKGFLIPRMSTAQITAILSPPEALMVYDTDLRVFKYRRNSVWVSVGSFVEGNFDVNGDLDVSGLGIFGSSLSALSLAITNAITAASATFTGALQAASATFTGALQALTGNFTSKILTGDGTVSAPSNSFISEVGSGLYRIATNKLGIAINGARVGEVGVGYGGFTGNIIQVLQASIDTQLTSSGTNSWNDITGLSVSITPKYINSKILIKFKLNAGANGQGVLNAYQILRNTTPVGNGTAPTAGKPDQRQCHSAVRGSAGDVNNNFTLSGEFLDSPATISATTYKIQFLVDSGTGYINRDDGSGNVNGYPSPRSVITVMEVQQ